MVVKKDALLRRANIEKNNKIRRLLEKSDPSALKYLPMGKMASLTRKGAFKGPTNNRKVNRKFQQSGALTRDSFLRRILKVCDLGRVEVR